MHTYICFYKNKKITVQAESSYEAQRKAAVILKVRRAYDVTPVLADAPVDPASL